MDEDIRTTILALMADGAARSLDDIVIALQTHPETRMIPTALTKMINEGFFENVGQSSRFPVYKRKAILPLQAPRKAYWAHQAEPVNAPNPMGVVDLEEGLELAIFKVMADRNYRSADEIADILATFGNTHRGQVKDKVIKMFISKKYFERRNMGGHRVTYSLKKFAPMPLSMKKSIFTDSLQPHPALEKELDGGITNTLGNLYAAPGKAQPKITPVESSTNAPRTPEVKHSPVCEPVNVNDGIKTAIWKVMSDREPYRSMDVAMLLEDFGFNPLSVVARLSDLRREGWFDAEKNPEYHREFIYTLRSNIPIPKHERPYMKYPIRSSSEPVQQPIEEELPVGNPPPVIEQQTSPLLNMNIRIKEMEFSFAEAKQILKELKAAGFGKGEFGTDSSIVSFSVTIRGKVFLAHELEELVQLMMAAGLDSLPD